MTTSETRRVECVCHHVQNPSYNKDKMSIQLRCAASSLESTKRMEKRTQKKTAHLSETADRGSTLFVAYATTQIR